MALKTDRQLLHHQIDFYMNEVAEIGGIVVASTVGSGDAMDQAEALVTYSASPSGKVPVGVLMNEMVNYDLTRQKLNPYKAEVQKGGKVDIVAKGVVVTDMIYPGLTVSANQYAYLGPSGLLQNTVFNNPTNNPKVGQFLSSKDEDGYAKVSINCPQ